jgi:hypothetical protein
MLQTAYQVVRQQRLAWSFSVIVGLFLILMGHAPVLPVLVGCALAVGLSALRSWPKHATQENVRPVRGGR